LAIAGVAILAKKEEIQNVYQRLEQIPEITTYGIHQEQYIVAVVETSPQQDLEKFLKKIQDNDPGILGIFPAYANFEDEVLGESLDELV